MIVTAHQPHLMPWLGYINRIHLADFFVLMDNMEYTHNHNINSNKLVYQHGTIKVVVPVKYKGASKKQIKDIEINYSRQWKQKLIKTIVHHYNARPGFAAFWDALHEILKKDHHFLFDLDYEIIQLILSWLYIDTKVIIASEHQMGGAKESDLFISLLEGTGCDTMLVGLGASKKYVHEEELKQKGFHLAGQIFHDPQYNQKSVVMLTGISSLDLLLNVSRDEASRLVKGAGSYEIRF